MNRVTIRFYGQLNYFLQAEKRQVSFEHRFKGNPSVKDLIESLGVPHTEIDLLLVNGTSSDFSYQLRGGERIAVYPGFGDLNISGISLVRPAAPMEYRFILDVHLGKLASYLRMAGFDARYDNDASDEQLADISIGEDRILLTFDRNLLKRKGITYGHIVHAKDPFEQLIEVLGHYDLSDRLSPFTRCMICNGILTPVEKEDVLAGLPDQVKETLDEFYRCTECGQVYWKGTHYEHMSQLIDEVRNTLHLSGES